MLKKLSKRFIIALILLMLLALATLYCLPFMYSNPTGFTALHVWLTAHKTVFLVYHSVFYLLFFLIWPSWVKRWVNQSTAVINAEQWQKALFLRYYVVGFFLYLELLNALR